jgi:hypothetical protein
VNDQRLEYNGQRKTLLLTIGLEEQNRMSCWSWEKVWNQGGIEAVIVAMTIECKQQNTKAGVGAEMAYQYSIFYQPIFLLATLVSQDQNRSQRIRKSGERVHKRQCVSLFSVSIMKYLRLDAL